ncbi:SRPBCC family protein [Micropruina glycogenica]|uniref:Activator of Hsp90 ATPase homolog 1-like protein n=1 Tax=Micropruina glycogenica TaxID=75385 RepID=A0A2N9JE03_9ACTN|nr:hypothetical protein [Micropruina glycogenica]SPD85614.1 protein of unknown function [Micropruina glycogenica]
MTEPLVITRLVPATPEQLWLAWTTEPGLATWCGTPGPIPDTG